MSLEVRVEKLEKEVRFLKDEILKLKGEIQGKEETDVQINVVDDFMIKLVYTGIYPKLIDDAPITVGFPKNRKRMAEQICVGQKMFLYVTSPVKKIIGLMKVVRTAEESKDPSSRWPVSITLEWEIGPKPGIAFTEAGLSIRPRVGDTLYSITSEKAEDIIAMLGKQNDLDRSTLEYLANEYTEK